MSVKTTDSQRLSVQTRVKYILFASMLRLHTESKQEDVWQKKNRLPTHIGIIMIQT